MKNSACTQEKQSPLGFIIEDLGKVFIENQSYEINYSISLKQIRKHTGVGGKAASCIVRKFLNSEGKSYESTGSGGGSGARYRITVNRKEFEKWRIDLLRYLR